MRDPREGLTADGMIRTGVHRARVSSDFEPILDDVTREFRLAASPGSELHLYGSVATGMARVGESDVDLLLINGSAAWAREVSARMSRRYAEVSRGVEIGTAQSSDYVGENDEAYGNRVFLRHYCVPLVGTDAIRNAEPFLGDAQAARGFNGDIAARLAHWRTGGANARTVARKTLVAAAGVISIRNRTWTTDRVTAAYAWADREPERRDEVMRLLAWSEGEDDPWSDQLDKALAPDGIVSAIADRFADEIGLWDAATAR